MRSAAMKKSLGNRDKLITAQSAATSGDPMQRPKGKTNHELPLPKPLRDQTVTRWGPRMGQR